jgi:hypothetical protein
MMALDLVLDGSWTKSLSKVKCLEKSGISYVVDG